MSMPRFRSKYYSRRTAKLTAEKLECRILFAAELEPNDAIATATAFSSNETLDGAISTLGDADFFKISLNQGAKLRLFDINFPDAFDLMGLPPSVDILDTAGNVLVTSFTGEEVESTAPETGVYTVRILPQSAFGTIVDTYRIKTSVSIFSGGVEQEPNDTVAAAKTLNTNRSFQGQLSTADTTDVYSFTLNANSAVTVNFAGLADSRPGARLLDSTGAVVDAGLAGEGIAANITTAGTYYLELIDNSAAGQTQSYVGTIQTTATAAKSTDTGDTFDEISPWTLGTNNSFIQGELTSLNDVDTYAINVSSLAKVDISLFGAGNENIPTEGRQIIAYDQQGAFVASSRNGTLGLERYLGKTAGEYFIQIVAEAAAGLGKYILRATNFTDFGNQRDVPLHLVDFTKQFPVYTGRNFLAPYAVTAAIPYITAFVDAQYSPYDVDITNTKPSIPTNRYIHSGYGDFENLNGGLGGGSYGTRRASGDTANNDESTSVTTIMGSGTLGHEFGHAAGLGHAREISNMMSYVHTDDIATPGNRFGFMSVDQRRPNTYTQNDRNRLDWNLSSGAQVPESTSDLNSPQDINPNFAEMRVELNDTPVTQPTQSNPNFLATGDFNGDGWKDLVVTSGGTTLGVYLSDAAGGFLPAQEYTTDAVGWWTAAIATGDFNKDGRDDIAVSSFQQQTLTVFTSKADGSLNPGVSLAIGRQANAIQSADMDADGNLDLVAVTSSSQVLVWNGKGDGTFNTSKSYTTGSGPFRLAIQDFNGDNKLDIATSNNNNDTVSVLLADATGAFSVTSTIQGGQIIRGITAGDFDGDNDVDLAVVGQTLGVLNIYSNKGDGTFTQGSSTPIEFDADFLTTTDANQDGKLDIIASGNTGGIKIFVQLNNGNFSRGVSFTTGTGPFAAVSLDANKDGLLDVATVAYWDNQVYVQTATPNSLRNDRAVIYGEISSANDVDVYSMSVAVGAEYSFDIDSAEFQYPLDSELTILAADGTVLASNKLAMDRETGIDSVDPYIVHKFATAGTIRIVVSSEQATVGSYRLKVTPKTALTNEGPKVLAVVPDNGSTINSTRQISFLLNKAIDPATLTSNSIIVRGATTGVQTGSAYFDPLDGFVIWTADKALPVDTFTVTIASGNNGLKDTFGNQLDGDIAANFKFPLISGDGTNGGDFISSFTVNNLDTTPPNLYYSGYQRDYSNHGRFEFRWDDDISFKSLESAQFTLRGAGPDGVFNTPDDRLQSMDAVYNKIGNLAFDASSISVYSRGVPDSDLYRVEATLLDGAGNTISLSQQFAVGSTVPESALSTDANRTVSGLKGTYIDQSLRAVTSTADWVSTQPVAGTRIDKTVAFNVSSFGKLTDVNLTGGTDSDWDDFSVQWDGYLTVPQNGIMLQTRSDDGSRMWIDLDKNGQFDAAELFDNGWGTGQAMKAGKLTPALTTGTYPIRIQYEEGGGGNAMLLEWITPGVATDEKGFTYGPSVIGMSIQPNTVYTNSSTDKIDIDFSGAIDVSTLTPANVRIRHSTDATFFDGNDTFLQDADGIIAFDPIINRATFETANNLPTGYFLVELNGKQGGIKNTKGALLDGEFLSNFIAGNTNIPSPSRTVSGDGFIGGDYRAAFSIQSGIGLTVQQSTISESSGTATITAFRTVATSTPLVINLTSSDPTAATVPASVTIPANQTSVTFTVTGVDDAIADGDQTAVITGTATGMTDTTLSFNVTDDEVASLLVTLTNPSIPEKAGTTVATVSRNTPTTSDLVVSLLSSLTSAATVPTTVTIPAGATSVTFVVNSVDDGLLTGNRISIITASATGFVSGTSQVTVLDDDIAQLSISLNNSSMSEKAGVIKATITRNTSTAFAQLVNITSSDTNSAMVPSTITIPIGAASFTFDITAVDDLIADGDKVSTISVTATSFAQASIPVTIVDDEAASLSLAFTSNTISENGGITLATVTRNTPTTLPLVVNLASSVTTAATVPTSVTIPAGQASITFSITAVNDLIADGVQNSLISASATGLGIASKSIAVSDDESPSLQLTFLKSSISEKLGATLATIKRNTPTAADMIVSLIANPSTGISLPLQVTIPAGSDSATFTITAIDNTLVDGDKLTTVTASAAGLASAVAQLTISDDEIAKLSVTVPSNLMPENKGTLLGTVTRNSPTTLPLVVTLTSNDTKIATVPASVTIPAGATSATFTIQSVDDLIAEGDQSAIISASAVGLQTGTVEVGLIDDEKALLQITFVNNSISENGGTTTAIVTRNTPTNVALSVQLASNNLNAATVPASITIPAGATTATFTVTAVNDALADGEQSSTITVASAGIAGTSKSILVTDDEVATLRVTLVSSSLVEKGGSTTATVHRNTPTTVPIVVTLSSLPISATTFPATITIPAGASSASFTLTAVDDNVASKDRIATLNATADGLNKGSTQFTLVDDDIAKLTLALSNTSMPEKDGIISAIVTRNTPIDVAQVVTLSSSDIKTAAVPATVTIPAGATSVGFTILSVDDLLADGTQSSTITASSPNLVSAVTQVSTSDNETAFIEMHLANSTIVEKGGFTTATISRNTLIGSSLTISLANSATGVVTVPTSITIPAGSAFATFVVSAIDNSLASGLKTSKITASAIGVPTVTDSISVEDDEVPSLSLTVSKSSLSENGGTAIGTISRNSPTTSPLTVSITNSNVEAGSAASLITIPAGAASATFTITAKDNSSATGNQISTITVSAAGLVSASTSLTYVDDETNQISISLSEQTMPEQDGLITATVSRNTPSTNPLVVTISKSNASILTAPITVTIPAGQASKSFVISSIDDLVADGDQKASITVSANGFASATSTEFTVEDNEQAAINLTLADLSISEKGGTTVATVVRNTPTTSSLLVNLTNGNPNAVKTPSTVTIPAGSSSATFTVTAIDNKVVNGTTNVVIGVSVTGLGSQSSTLAVTDDDVLWAWQNTPRPFDVNGDNSINAVDVLVLINDLFRLGRRSLPTPTTSDPIPPYFPDVNGDGSSNSLDVLDVINFLFRNGPSEGEAPAEQTPPSSITEPSSNTESAFGDVSWVDNEFGSKKRSTSGTK